MNLLAQQTSHAMLIDFLLLISRMKNWKNKNENNFCYAGLILICSYG